MSPLHLSAAAVILLTCILSTASAFNITRILNRYPEYGVFNDLLSRTGLASDINRHSTVTVLAVKNGQVGDLTSRPIDLAESILRTHVILDYYDIMKLHRLKYDHAKVTTMYQQTGIADKNQGFLNVTSGKDGVIFGSAVRHSPHDARLEEAVMSRPYNISVLCVSRRRRRKRAPAPAEEEVPAPDSDSSDYAPSDSPADAPGPDADAADKSSAGKSAAVSLAGFFLLLCSLLAAH
nr:fasciclin-like arabinogalactan protein 3 [Ipomoea batatas]